MKADNTNIGQLEDMTDGMKMMNNAFLNKK